VFVNDEPGIPIEDVLAEMDEIIAKAEAKRAAG